MTVTVNEINKVTWQGARRDGICYCGLVVMKVFSDKGPSELRLE